MNFKTLIVLYAPGMCVAKIANKEAMDYICSFGPTIQEKTKEESIPDNVLFGFEDQFPVGTGKIIVTALQCADERANAIPGIMFNSKAEAMRYSKEHNFILDKEYRGVLNKEV